MSSLGERVRKIRTNSGLSVRDLAARVGVSASFIYQLEKSESAPSFSTLKRIASELGTSVGVLTDDEFPEEWVVVRNDHRRHVVTGQPGFAVDLLPFLGSRDKRMQPHLFSLEPGQIVDQTVYIHERDDFLLLLEGTVEVSAQGRWYRLEAGDAAYFSLHSLNRLRNPGTQTARGIWMIAPSQS